MSVDHSQDDTHNPKVIFRNPPFSFHRSLARYVIPLSKFSKLPSNAGKRTVVGAAILAPPTQDDDSLEASGGVEAGDGRTREGQWKSHAKELLPRILLAQRSSHETLYPNEWEIPGGEAEYGIDQTILETVVREVREETGLRVVEVLRDFEGFEYGSEDRRSKQYNFLVKVDLKQEYKVILDPEEHQAFAWVSKRDMEGEDGNKFKMTKEMRRCVMNALEAWEKALSVSQRDRDLICWF
jgi:8-oxo-dGTP pyrophosphatase MutT (NUDIX family)